MPALNPRTRLAAQSIFATMSVHAAQHGAINLGQGYPSSPPPAFLVGALGGHDQYTPPIGLPGLRAALGTDLNVDPADVVITCGATEAMHALALALYGPGDEVLAFEPVFDIYPPQAELAGATLRLAPIRLGTGTLGAAGWTPDLDALEALISPRTRAIIVNTPHNPTGHCFTAPELTQIAALARQHDLWLIADEVYDELYYAAPPLHVRDYAPERTFTVGSAGKRLEATGWRVGWIVTPPDSAAPGLAAQVAGLHQWATFCAPAPLQAAVAVALPIARQTGFYDQLRASYGGRMRRLAAGLRGLGLTVYEPGGSYFLNALLPGADTVAGAMALAEGAGVTVIPGSAFYREGAAPAGLCRFAFCKPEADLEEAVGRLGRYLRG